jgi:hypothetical protein
VVPALSFVLEVAPTQMEIKKNKQQLKNETNINAAGICNKHRT